MNKKLLKTCLLAAGLLVGGSVWAVTETYNISSWMGSLKANVDVYDFGSEATTFTGENDASVSCYAITTAINGNSLNGRLALSNTHRSNGKRDHVWFRFNNTEGNSYTGLFVGSNRSTYFSVLNLLAGDKITITFKNAPTGVLFYSSNATYDVSGTATAIVSGTTVPTSGTEYTMTADGHLDMFLPAFSCIGQVVIETSASESMGTPNIKATGANGGTRTITITPGVGSGGSAATATYYTTDGTEPSSSSTAYTAPFDITETTTIKAISYLGTVAGDVATQQITAGTTLPLTDATLTHSANGKYTIASNQSSVIGNPTATIHYQIDGGEENTSSDASVTVEVWNDGEINYWLTATGYTATSEKTETVYAPVAYAAANTINFCTSNNNNWATYNAAFGSGVAISTDDTEHNYYKYYDAETSTTLGEGIMAVTQNNVNTEKGFWGWRVQRYYGGVTPYNGTEYVALLDLKAGQIIQIACGSAPVSTTNLTAVPAATYTGTFTYTVAADGDAFFGLGTGNVMKTIKFCETTIAATLGTNGYSTFASPYALDLTTANLPSGVKAYKAAVEGTTVKFTELNQWVPAYTGILLEGSKGATVNIPVAANSTAVTDNEFLVNTTGETFDAESGFTYYGMMKATTADDPIVFATFAPGSVAIPADKAYLKVSNGSAARLSVVFEESTGISTIETVKAQNGETYNLSGQRVAQPQKGLYIVNGKKVIIK